MLIDGGCSSRQCTVGKVIDRMVYETATVIAFSATYYSSGVFDERNDLRNGY